MQQTEISYAKNTDGEYIAHQSFGDGPADVVFVPDWVTNLEIMREAPTVARFLDRLSGFSRLVCFDKRGTGLSDPVSLGAPPSYEEWTDDLGTVLDAVGLDRAALVGHGDGGHMAIRFAAMHPHRVSALVLVDTYARRRRAPGYPHGIPDHLVSMYVDAVVSTWGKGTVTRAGGAPSLADDERFIAWRGRYERLSMGRGPFEVIYPTTYDIDVRSILSFIQAPTLVLHREDNGYIRIGNGEYLAEHIPGARFKALPGSDHFFHAGDTKPMLREIQSFLTGTSGVPEENRVLATVLFTDIVDATRLAQELGDQDWAYLLELHHAKVRHEIERFRGREVDNAGDGFFATFDGPARAVRCALAIRDSVRSIGIEIRAGLHTGECELLGPKVSGIAVHIGARVMTEAGPGQVTVSRTVKDLVVGSGLHFQSLGEHTLKGVDGTWELFEATA
jgi:class 3 adenylate cyclase